MRHIWAYKDAAERFGVRERARNEGVSGRRAAASRRHPQAGETRRSSRHPSRRCISAKRLASIINWGGQPPGRAT